MHKKYKLESVDFVAVHVIPAGAWFIIPWLATPSCIFLSPGKKESKYHQYEKPGSCSSRPGNELPK
jgi:hypothetical protein